MRGDETITQATTRYSSGSQFGGNFDFGRRFGPALRETKIIQKYGTEGWDKATDILRRRGAWAVFFARFLPVVRTLTPAAAGTSGLPYRKFLPAVVAGAARAASSMSTCIP